MILLWPVSVFRLRWISTNGFLLWLQSTECKRLFNTTKNDGRPVSAHTAYSSGNDQNACVLISTGMEITHKSTAVWSLKQRYMRMVVEENAAELDGHTKYIRTQDPSECRLAAQGVADKFRRDRNAYCRIYRGEVVHEITCDNMRRKYNVASTFVL